MGTKEPCDKDETTADVTDAPASDIELRRNLGRDRHGRRRGDATKEPCADGEDCSRRRRHRRDNDSTKEPCDDDATTETPADGAVPALRRLLRRGDRVTQEPCGRGRGRRDSDSQEATEDPVQLRRALRHGGRRRGSNLDATISNGIVEVAGIEGTVVFGEVDETLESVPLTLTLGETVFTCDVRVRGNEGDRVSCRATSEDEFKVRIGCAIEANEEL